MKYLAFLNALIPGSGLLLRDRMLLGCGLLIFTICLIALVMVAPMIMDDAFAQRSQLYALAVYAGLTLCSALLWWRLEVATPLADAMLREKHAFITKAWLGGREDEARTEAKALVRRARHLPEAWALLALVVDSEQAAHAQRRADELRQRGL